MRYRYLYIVAALFLIVGMGLQAFVSYRLAAVRVQKRIDAQLEIAHQKLLFDLYDAYDATALMKDFVEDEMNDPNELLEETRVVLKRYPQLFSCYVSFPKDYIPEEGRWFCPASYRLNDSIYTIKFGDKDHDYFKRDWYIGALENEEAGYWGQPYMDEDFDEAIYTYSRAMKDKNGGLWCVLACDFAVSWVRRLLDRYEPFKEAVFVLYNSNGELLMHSGEEEIRRFGDEWLVSRRMLQPMDIDLVMAVPKSYVWRMIAPSIAAPAVVLIFGVLVVGLLLRRILRSEKESARLAVVENELQIAHTIQMSILPKRAFSDERLAISGMLIPMKEVGGDLYDYRLEGDTLWFIIGDVSGKGMPAAMFMSATVNLFRAAGRHSHSPKQLMEEMNAVLSENNPSLTFVTALIGRIDLTTGEMRYCNAGHCAPLKVKGEWLEMEPNIPLGYDGNFAYVEQKTRIASGETLVLYTDGITEARNEQREFFGQQRLAEVVNNGERLSVSGERVLQAVRQFMGRAEQTDDITLMTIRLS